MDFKALKYQERFVDLCNHLLVKRYPDVKIVDGRGGDDGIDVFMGDISRPDSVFQIKYFSEIKDPQWRQIENSLKTVYEKRKPKKWVLIVSVDFNKWTWDKWEVLRKQFIDVELEVWTASTLAVMVNEERSSFARSFHELFPDDYTDAIANAVVQKLDQRETKPQPKITQEGVALIYDRYNDRILNLSPIEQARVKAAVSKVSQLFKDVGTTININEINVKAVSKLGISFYHMGLLDEARFMIDLVLREYPDDLRSLNNKGATYHKDTELEEALKWVQKALNIQPDYFDAQVNKGAILVDMDKPKDGVEILEPLFNEKPDDEVVLRNLVLGFTKLANEQKALYYYEKAKGIVSNAEIMYNDIGCLYLRSSKPNEALEYFDKLLQVAPDDTTVIVNKTAALIELKYYILASWILEDVIKRHPKQHDAMTNLAIVYFQRRRVYDALHWGLLSLEFDSIDVITLNIVGLSHMTLGDIEEGLKFFELALAQKRDYIFALANKATNLMLLRRYKEALDCLEEFLQLKPDDPTMLHNREYLKKLLESKNQNT